MKKVIVLVAMLSLVASSAFAVIQGSKHDLSPAGPQAATDQNTTETCVFCHTPHTAATAAPLWNRNNPTVTVTQYNSSTMNTIGAYAGDVPLCLSCHAGTNIATVTLVNEPNVGAVNPGSLTIGTGANIGGDLTDDHPVGFSYTATLVSDDGELNAAATLTGAVKLYGASGDVMWCASCHDVHKTTYTPFLVTSNAASAICTACHAK